MATGMARISLDEEIKRLTHKRENLRKSFENLQNKTSAYANEHILLITAYEKARECLVEARETLD